MRNESLALTFLSMKLFFVFCFAVAVLVFQVRGGKASDLQLQTFLCWTQTKMEQTNKQTNKQRWTQTKMELGINSSLSLLKMEEKCFYVKKNVLCDKNCSDSVGPSVCALINLTTSQGN